MIAIKPIPPTIPRRTHNHVRPPPFPPVSPEEDGEGLGDGDGAGAVF